ncbi:MAG: N-acetylmuramoyl-L-alanine amidase [Clostridia bacterium]|nr:N-acetylmuramoyl-L-alanine amidase [Clostridia bacterium]
MKRYLGYIFLFTLLFSLFVPLHSFAGSGNILLLKGMSGEHVLKFQQDLKRVGFFDYQPTGFFGETTEDGVKRLQKKYKLSPDGKVGEETHSLIHKLIKNTGKKNVKIVVDPGHGGIDPGTLLGKESESKMALDISKMVGARLIEKNYQVEMTRRSDVSLYKLSMIKGTLEQRDLNARVHIINKSKAKLFVSIHVNSNPYSPNLSGSVVYYNGKIPQSKELAQSIQRELNSIVVNNKHRAANRSQTANYYILKNSNIPGVLVETAYVTNKEERQLLTSKDFRQKLALAITKGIQGFLK